MTIDHTATLRRSRAKLVEQRRALVKRDCSSDRNEGYCERIVIIQAAIDATDRAIGNEELERLDALASVPAQAFGNGTDLSLSK